MLQWLNLTHMPKYIKTPIWFDGFYEKMEPILISLINEAFTMPSDKELIELEGYLSQIKDSHLLEERDLHAVLTSQESLCWGVNIGHNSIYNSNRTVLKQLLPSYLISSIQLFDLKTSIAESLDLPFHLAIRLRKPEASTLDDFWQQFHFFTVFQMRIIRTWLDLIARRSNEEGDEARNTLKSFWQIIPSLQINVG